MFSLKKTKNCATIFPTACGFAVILLSDSRLPFFRFAALMHVPHQLDWFGLLPCSRHLCLVRVLFILQLTARSCVLEPPSRVCWTVCNYPQGLPWATLPGTTATICQQPPRFSSSLFNLIACAQRHGDGKRDHDERAVKGKLKRLIEACVQGKSICWHGPFTSRYNEPSSQRDLSISHLVAHASLLTVGL